MKNLFISAIVLFAIGSLRAQSFEKGTKEVQLEIGLGARYTSVDIKVTKLNIS